MVTESGLVPKKLSTFHFAEEKYKVANKSTTSKAPEANYLNYSCILCAIKTASMHVYGPKVYIIYDLA